MMMNSNHHFFIAHRHHVKTLNTSLIQICPNHHGFGTRRLFFNARTLQGLLHDLSHAVEKILPSYTHLTLSMTALLKTRLTPSILHQNGSRDVCLISVAPVVPLPRSPAVAEELASTRACTGRWLHSFDVNQGARKSSSHCSRSSMALLPLSCLAGDDLASLSAGVPVPCHRSGAVACRQLPRCNN